MTARWMTYEEVAEILHCNVKTVERKVRTGEWTATKLGPRFYRFKPEQLEALGIDTTPPKRKPNNLRKQLRDAA